jgi:hypothetical protein
MEIHREHHAIKITVGLEHGTERICFPFIQYRTPGTSYHDFIRQVKKHAGACPDQVSLRHGLVSFPLVFILDLSVATG